MRAIANRIESLWELMKRLKFEGIAALLGILERTQLATDAQLLNEAPDLLTYSQAGKASFELLGLNATLANLERLRVQLTQPELSTKEIRRAADHLQTSLTDDLDRSFLIRLTHQEEAWLTSVQPFGEQVTTAFPSASHDTDEATRCLAFARYTACVFHLMRVVEVGVKALGARLSIDTTHKPGWEQILKKAHGQMSLPNDKKDADWIKDEDFLSDAITMLTAIKTAWRNPTMHIEKKYTPEHAERIYDAVKGFMQQLATKLHE